MQAIIIDNHTANTRKLKRLLSAHNPRIIKVEDLMTVTIKPGALLVLSGSSTTPVLYQHLYDKEIELIKNHTGPIIGICLGFELIAHIYGAHLHQRAASLHGLVHVQKNDKPAADFLPDARQLVYVNHHFDVRQVPTQLIDLARSASDIQILRHVAKPIFGLQFHPGVRRGRNNGRQIFELILAQINSEIK